MQKESSRWVQKKELMMLMFNDYEEDAASVDSVVDADSLFVNGRKEIRSMADFDKRALLYAPNGTDLSALINLVESKGDYIQGGYDFIEEPGECNKLFDMLDLAIAGDKIYVPSIIVFQYGSFTEFKEMLQYLNDTNIEVVSLAEPDYQFGPYITAINVVFKDVLHKYVKAALNTKLELEEEIAALNAEKENQLKRGGRPKKEIQAIEAVALHKGKRHSIDEICALTGLSKSTLYRALAETYEQEEKEQSEDGDQD